MHVRLRPCPIERTPQPPIRNPCGTRAQGITGCHDDDEGLETPMRHPTLFQCNTRIYLYELGRRLGRPATLRDIPDSLLDELGEGPYQWVWLLGVWQTGPKSRDVSVRDPRFFRSLAAELPDLREEDISGSPFAVQEYRVRPAWGGDDALAALRQRMASRGLRLMLDFVVNHVGLDHPWVETHPEYFVHGTPDDLAREPQNYTRVTSRDQELILAHGRDPYFDGWPDTLQLDFFHEGLRRAMRESLASIAERCDGVRCDMAMLVQPDVFERTWGERTRPADGSPASTGPFWPEAIARTRLGHPDFTFMAEVYWDREWELQHEGFDFTYDKRLYDRLRTGTGHVVREHLLADLDYQAHSVRFLENHDEPRAAAVFSPDVERAAAVIAYGVPGMRFVHQGQVEGRKAHVSMHLGRGPDEPVDPAMIEFYGQLLACLKRPELHEGDWRLWVCRPAWNGNASFQHFIVMSWKLADRCLWIAVNYAPEQGQCHVPLDLEDLGGGTFVFDDLLGDARYVREGNGLRHPGLYLDMPAWGYHLFEMQREPG